MPSNLSTAAARKKAKTTSENLLYGADFTLLLNSGETLTGTPVIRNQPTGLTFASPVVNTGSLTGDDGQTIAIGAAVQVRISGGAFRTGTLQAATLNTVTLDSGASAIDNFYNGLMVSITGNTGIGQPALPIASYVGATKVATLGGNWEIIPDATSTFAISGITYTFILQCGTSQSNTRELVCSLQVIDA
jgi:hypothetical protein